MAPGDDELVSTDISRAVECIDNGGLVAIPTETVYGLAAGALDRSAVARVFDVKSRPLDHPLIVHLAAAADLDRWSNQPSEDARLLADAAWPGPLTLIVPRSDLADDAVTGGRDSVGLRVPAHPMTHELIERAGPLAAPSANRYGAVSPTTARHVLDELGDLLDPATDLILDGGPCPVGVESTIVDCVDDPPQILRAGGVTNEEIHRLLDHRLARPSGPARASGMRTSHYAPRCEIKLVDDLDDAVALRAGTVGADVLDLGDDLGVAARDLYVRLRAADERGVSTLIVVLPPPVGLGHAIRDRLEKAAAPR